MQKVGELAKALSDLFVVELFRPGRFSWKLRMQVFFIQVEADRDTVKSGDICHVGRSLEMVACKFIFATYCNCSISAAKILFGSESLIGAICPPCLYTINLVNLLPQILTGCTSRYTSRLTTAIIGHFLLNDPKSLRQCCLSACGESDRASLFVNGNAPMGGG